MSYYFWLGEEADEDDHGYEPQPIPTWAFLGLDKPDDFCWESYKPA